MNDFMHHQLRRRVGRAWLVQGLQHGYPPCCIAAFVNITPPNRDYHIPPEYTDTGFIPCKLCALRPVHEVLEEIASHRIKSLPPFPKGAP